MKKNLFLQTSASTWGLHLKETFGKLCQPQLFGNWGIDATAANCGGRASGALQAALKVASADESCEQGGKAVNKNVWRIFSQRALDMFFMPPKCSNCAQWYGLCTCFAQTTSRLPTLISHTTSIFGKTKIKVPSSIFWNQRLSIALCPQQICADSFL